MRAHGKTFADKAAAEARIAEINEENYRLGISDGRVTEILTIMEMMILWEWEQTPIQAFREKHDTWSNGHFIRATERGIEVGSRVVGVMTIWGNSIACTGTVTAIHPATVVVRLDNPVEAEGPYAGDWKTYRIHSSTPGRLLLEDEVW